MHFEQCAAVLQVPTLVCHGPCLAPACQAVCLQCGDDSDDEDMPSLVTGTEAEVSDLFDDVCGFDSDDVTVQGCDVCTNPEVSRLLIAQP
jgi:hypothetical protein